MMHWGRVAKNQKETDLTICDVILKLISLYFMIDARSHVGTKYR
jgi:hypothetical protein